jgi:long-chain acyl-CoA synthetase
LPLRWKHALAYRLVFQKLSQALGGRIRFLVSAGAPISREIVEFFSAAGLYVMEGYGATETTAPVSVNVLDDYRFGTVGKPLPGVEIRIDPLNGEILVKGGNIFVGYHNLPEETARSFTEDGFFRTGDVGHLDQDGFLVITDRIKDLIITSGGKNVAPQNIENLLKGDPLFSQVVVIGEGRKFLTALFNLDPDEIRRKGQGLGLIDPDPDTLMDDPRILSWVRDKIKEKNQHLARYEQIKDFRIIKTPFSQEGGELTPTLKLRRKVIMEKYNDLIESMYPLD